MVLRRRSETRSSSTRRFRSDSKGRPGLPPAPGLGREPEARPDHCEERFRTWGNDVGRRSRHPHRLGSPWTWPSSIASQSVVRVRAGSDDMMARIAVRKSDDGIERRLERHAADHVGSIGEARDIRRRDVGRTSTFADPGETLLRRSAAPGDVDLPPREAMPQGPCLDRCAMILISTGVASEPMRADPAPAVLHWSGRRETLDLHRSAVSGAELRPGVAILSEHGRRDALPGAVDAMVAENFAARILPFDRSSAAALAVIFAERRAADRLPGPSDRRHGSDPRRGALRGMRDRAAVPPGQRLGWLNDVGGRGSVRWPPAPQ